MMHNFSIFLSLSIVREGTQILNISERENLQYNFGMEKPRWGDLEKTVKPNLKIDFRVIKVSKLGFLLTNQHDIS